MSSKNSITFSSHIPVFLQKYHSNLENDRILADTKDGQKEEREEKEEEGPTIVNKNEYRYEIQNNLIGGLSKRNGTDWKDCKDDNIGKEFINTGNQNTTILVDKIGNDNESEIPEISDIIDINAPSLYSDTVEVGLIKQQHRIENNKADEIEKLGSHAFRKSRRMMNDSKDDISKKIKTNASKKNLLSFDVEDE